MPSLWKNKFEIKPGYWVFEPSEECRVIGNELKNIILGKWQPPDYYFHFQYGGHVAAAKSHFGNIFFLKLDLSKFFYSINRSRITRNLKEFFEYSTARDYAKSSTVRDPNNKYKFFLPYGYVQSLCLASLALSKSQLGTELNKIRKNNGCTISVYVDDLIISSNNIELLYKIKDVVIDSAKKSKFLINENKTEGPSTLITAFNFDISYNSVKINETRFYELLENHKKSDLMTQKEGIEGYVRSVDLNQYQFFMSLI